MRSLNGILLLLLFSCSPSAKKEQQLLPDQIISTPSLLILGTLQDGGSPHIGCQKKCCQKLFFAPDPLRKVVSLAIVDPQGKSNYLFEATPDLPAQLRVLKAHSPFKTKETPDGIFLTHAHIGHYAGLMYLGKEAMNSEAVKVYAMPRMKTYLETNGPWSQLLSLKNIELQSISENEEILLSSSIKVIPFRVPHRDEYSETVGYRIMGPKKKILFIPDINKWSKWETSVAEEIKKVDYALIDGTFFDGAEIQNRDITEIPHPFVVESMQLFDSFPKNEKDKIYFIHLNHTNPLLDPESRALKELMEKGFHVAQMGQIIKL